MPQFLSPEGFQSASQARKGAGKSTTVRARERLRFDYFVTDRYCFFFDTLSEAVSQGVILGSTLESQLYLHTC